MQHIWIYHVIYIEIERMRSYTEIIQQCKKQQREGQMEFYNLFYRSIYNSCYRILNNREDAEDIMQETFLKIFNRLDKMPDNPADMERLLKRMGINASIDMIRKRKIEFLEIDRYGENVPDIESDPDQDMIQVEQIREAMEQLPSGYKLIFNLHLIEELKYEEIADLLHLATSTVRSQFARARQKIISILNHNTIYE